MIHWLFGDWERTSLLLGQTRAALEIVEPFPSPEMIWWIGAVLLLLWLFVVGASVGSFLNVVVYRLPAGMSLSTPGSRCPRCGAAIRWHHNLPVVGWLLLRGKCADCQLPIAARYPLVELLVGLLFLLIGGLETLGQGINLPKPTDGRRPVLSTSEPIPLGLAVTMHVALVATLVGAALIDHDGALIPLRIAVPVLLFAVVVAVIYPQVHPFGARDNLGLVNLPNSKLTATAGVMDVVIALAAGASAAALIALGFCLRPEFLARYLAPLTLLWLAISMVFGWQLVPWLFACWGLTFLIAGHASPQRLPRPAPGLAAVVVGSLAAWRLFADYSEVLGEPLNWQLIAMVGMLLLGWLCLFVAAQKLPGDLAFGPVSSPYAEPLSAETPIDQPHLEQIDTAPSSDSHSTPPYESPSP